LAGGFLPKRFAQKPRENLGVWFQLQLLAARSRPEAEPNSHIVPPLTGFHLYIHENTIMILSYIVG
jgi:hypothetical protein